MSLQKPKPVCLANKWQYTATSQAVNGQ